MCKGFTFQFALKFAMVLIAVRPALAAQAPEAAAPVSEEAAAKADALRQAAQMDVSRQRWAEAEAKLLAAFGLNRSYDIAANLGNAQYRLGKYRDAAEHLAFAVRSWPVIGKREQREFSAKRLAEVRKHIASVTIRVSVPGAMVLVDGVAIGKAPLAGEVFVEPGAHVIEAKLEGYEAAKQGVSAAAGAAQDVEIRLLQLEKKESGERSKLGGSAEEQGGDAAGQQARSAQRQAPKTLPPEGERAEGGPNKGVVIAGIAASVTAVGLGVGFAVASNANASDAEAQRTAAVQRNEPDPCENPAHAQECSSFQDAMAARDRFGNMALWSFLIGGAVGAGTLVYVLVTPKPKSATSMHATPIATSRGAGLMITGTW